MSILRSVLFVLGVALLGSPSVDADEPILIRFAHVVGENTPKGVGAQRFKELVDERLAGRVRVEIYPRSTKVNDDQALLALLFGDIEMAAPSLAKFRSFTRTLQVFDLPFLFDDVSHVRRFQEGPAGRALLESMRSRGIVGLAFWDNGMRVISANTPLRAPDDARGLTFRIEPSSVIQDQYARIGVLGIPMPFSRVTGAIREGLVDGQENAWSNVYSRGIHELHRYFTEIDHSFLGYMVVASAEFWDGLPDDIRSELEAILAEVTREVNALAAEQAAADRQRALGAGEIEIVTVTEDDRQAWREAFTPVWEVYAPQIGQEVIDAAIAASPSR